ncbi:MAG: GrpB family protein [Saccharospirillum sp.]
MADHEQQVHQALTEAVELTPYNDQWPLDFIDEAVHLRNLLPADSIGCIEHFGSTAVPGLAAKPIIDMLIEVPSLQRVPTRIAPILAQKGYEYFWRAAWYDANLPAYCWFIKRNRHGERTHHLHFLEPDAPEWERLLFRDYLREHPQAAQQYEAIKRDARARFGDDRLAYAEAKSAFIEKIMALVA